MSRRDAYLSLIHLQIATQPYYRAETFYMTPEGLRRQTATSGSLSSKLVGCQSHEGCDNDLVHDG
jgi:hypothetical protein